MTCSSPITRDGRRERVVRLLVAVVASLCVSLPVAHLSAAADPAPSPEVTVREERGAYVVTARFEVPQPPETVLAVLADYERIPQFIPDVRTSIVRERTPGRLLVEQEAVSKFMMFSKKVHLLLEVIEGENAIHFVDRCGKSFRSYEGSWRAASSNGGTIVTYELAARPGFDVPEFILKRLLKRDSVEMIGRLRTEFSLR